MAKTERPKSRLPDGRVNPDYTAWRKANILNKPEETVQPAADEFTPEPAACNPEPALAGDHVGVPVVAEAAEVALLDDMESEAGTVRLSQITGKQPAPVAFTAINPPLPDDMESSAGSSPDPASFPINSAGDDAPLTTFADVIESIENGISLISADGGLEPFQTAPEPEQTSNDPRDPDETGLELLTLLCIKPATNDRFVLCAHPTEKGKMVPVRLHKKIAGRLIKKPIQVRVEGEGESVKYFHAR